MKKQNNTNEAIAKKNIVNYSNKTREMIQTGLLIALVFIATSFINIRLPIAANGGLVHLGTGMLYISAIVFGKKKGALSGAIGMALFDLVSGWTLWAPFTFIIRGIMGYIVGLIASKNEGKNIITNVVAIIVSVPVIIIGYYITEGILYGNWITPMASIPGNITQCIVGAIIAIPACKVLKKIKL